MISYSYIVRFTFTLGRISTSENLDCTHEML